MAMIKCPECGKEISDNARNCPNCGWENSQIRKAELKGKRGRKLGTGLIFGGVGVFAFTLIMWLLLGPSSREEMLLKTSLFFVVAGIVVKFISREK